MKKNSNYVEDTSLQRHMRYEVGLGTQQCRIEVRVGVVNLASCQLLAWRRTSELGHGFSARRDKISGQESVLHHGGVSDVDGSVKSRSRLQQLDDPVKHGEGIGVTEFDFRD